MDQSRSPGCICVAGASPICPASHRVVLTPTPEWVRRASARELPHRIDGGVALDTVRRPSRGGAHV